MNIIKNIFSLLVLSLALYSCTSETEEPIEKEFENYQLVDSFESDQYLIEILSLTGDFRTGYNDLILHITKDGKDASNLNPEWIHIMNMMTKTHSGPKSKLTPISDAPGYYEGFLVFQMANLDGSGWTLDINPEPEVNLAQEITVINADQRTVYVFTATDQEKYILTYISPNQPEIAINNLTLGLFKMETMMSFPVVENFSLLSDPRMPSMDNHSSPNNTPLIYKEEDQNYQGNLSLTMSGLWNLNFILQNEQGEAIYGTEVTENNITSELYLSLSF
ncbi:MAG: hypothetical protein ACPGRE_07175 [Flavobacteriaceae bacterium]